MIGKGMEQYMDQSASKVIFFIDRLLQIIQISENIMAWVIFQRMFIEESQFKFVLRKRY